MKHPHIIVKDGVWYPAGADVPVGTPVSVEMTDDVPDGALDTNVDGSVNAYDEDGNVVGTVSAEEVEQLQEQAGEAFEAQEQAGETLDEQEKPKRGRKPKEA